VPTSKQVFIRVAAVFLLSGIAFSQSIGTSGSIDGTVVDLSGAVVANGTVEIHNPVSHFDRSATTDAAGNFSIPNVPFNPYHMTIKAEGFAAKAQDVDVRSVVPVKVQAR
jgi:Carboxypeptidase regulatory-like domain